jgi:hypothetical protein
MLWSNVFVKCLVSKLILIPSFIFRTKLTYMCKRFAKLNCKRTLFTCSSVVTEWYKINKNNARVQHAGMFLIYFLISVRKAFSTDESFTSSKSSHCVHYMYISQYLIQLTNSCERLLMETEHALPTFVIEKLNSLVSHISPSRDNHWPLTRGWNQAEVSSLRTFPGSR